MQQNNENEDATKPLPEVPRNGDADSLPKMQRERMEPCLEQSMSNLHGEGVSINPEGMPRAGSWTPDGDILWKNLGAGTSGSRPPWVYQRASPLRFYIGAVAIGIGCGISCSLALIDSSQARQLLSHDHALMILYGIAAFTFAFQTVFLVLENRRLERENAKMKAYFDGIGYKRELHT